MQVVGPQHPVYGGTSAATGFSVVGSAVAIGIELPSVADVPCRVVVRPHRLEVMVDRCFSRGPVRERQRKGVAVEFAALGFEQTGSRTVECGKSVPHL